MKAIKRTTKIIIISVVALVCAAAIVLGCVFGLRNGDVNNPTPPEPEKTLSASQIALGMKVNEWQNKQSSELTELDEKFLSDESGENKIDFKALNKITENGIMTQSGAETDFYVFCESEGKRYSKSIKEFLKIEETATNFRVEDAVDGYVLLSYDFLDESNNRISSETHMIVCVKNPQNVVVVNKFSAVKNSDDTITVDGEEFNAYHLMLFKSMYVVHLARFTGDAQGQDQEISYDKITFGAYVSHEATEADTYELVIDDMNNLRYSEIGDHGFVFADKNTNVATIGFVNGSVKVAQVELDAEKNYTFTYLSSGVFVEEEEVVTTYEKPANSVHVVDEQKDNYALYSYKLVNFEENKFVDLALDENYVKMELSANAKNLDYGDFFYVCEFKVGAENQLSKTVGKFVYFDKLGNRVIAYDTVADETTTDGNNNPIISVDKFKIFRFENPNFVTGAGIFTAKGSVNATCVNNFVEDQISLTSTFGGNELGFIIEENGQPKIVDMSLQSLLPEELTISGAVAYKNGFVLSTEDGYKFFDISTKQITSLNFSTEFSEQSMSLLVSGMGAYFETADGSTNFIMIGGEQIKNVQSVSSDNTQNFSLLVLKLAGEGQRLFYSREQNMPTFGSANLYNSTANYIQRTLGEVSTYGAANRDTSTYMDLYYIPDHLNYSLGSWWAWFVTHYQSLDVTFSGGWGEACVVSNYSYAECSGNKPELSMINNNAQIKIYCWVSDANADFSINTNENHRCQHKFSFQYLDLNKFPGYIWAEPYSGAYYNTEDATLNAVTNIYFGPGYDDISKFTIIGAYSIYDYVHYQMSSQSEAKWYFKYLFDVPSIKTNDYVGFKNETTYVPDPYKPIPYKISVNYAGGSGSHPTGNIEFGNGFRIETPTRSGYTFMGWQISGMSTDCNHYIGNSTTTAESYTSSSDAAYFKNLTSTYAGTVYLTATWKDTVAPTISRYVLVQNGNGGFFGYCYATDNIGVSSVAFIARLTSSSSSSSKTYYASSGSYSYNGSSYNYRAYIPISDFSNNYGPYSVNIRASDAESNNQFKYPSAFYFKFNLTLNRSPFSGGTSSVTQTYGSGWSPSSITKPTTSHGYRFVGYYTQSGRRGTQIYNSSGNLVSGVSSKLFTSDSMLYAYYEEVPSLITVITNADVSSCSFGSTTYGYGDTTDPFFFDFNCLYSDSAYVEFYELRKVGFTFAGWAVDGVYSTADSTIYYGYDTDISLSLNSFDIVTGPDLYFGLEYVEPGSTLTFTAIWEPITYNLYFEGDYIDYLTIDLYYINDNDGTFENLYYANYSGEAIPLSTIEDPSIDTYNCHYIDIMSNRTGYYIAGWTIYFPYLYDRDLIAYNAILYEESYCVDYTWDIYDIYSTGEYSITIYESIEYFVFANLCYIDGGEVVFEPIWAPATYNLKVDVSSSDNKPTVNFSHSTFTFDEDEWFELSEPLTRVGYNFVGWNFNGQSTSTSFSRYLGTSPDSYVSVTTKPYQFNITDSAARIYFKNFGFWGSNVTITPVWEAVHYNVILDLDGGTCEHLEDCSGDCFYNNYYSMYFYSISRPGYIFAGFKFTNLLIPKSANIYYDYYDYYDSTNYWDDIYEDRLLNATEWTIMQENSNPSRCDIGFWGLRSEPGEVVIQALWEPIPYNVRIDPDGGTFDDYDYDSPINFGEMGELFYDSIHRLGYTLVGWEFSNLTTGHEKYFENYYDSFTIGEDETSAIIPVDDMTNTVYYRDLRCTSEGEVLITALWEYAEYQIQVVANGGTGSGLNFPKSVKWGEESYFEFSSLIRTGYTFAGWEFSNLTTGHTKFVNVQQNSLANIVDTNLRQYRYTYATSPTTRIYFRNLRSEPGTVLIKALWEPITYSVEVDTGGGTGSGLTNSSPYTFDVNENFKFSSLSKVGYTFKGWLFAGLSLVENYVGADASHYETIPATSSTYTYVTSSPTAAVYFKNLRSTSGIVTITAQWTPNTYNVIIDNVGGVGTPTTTSPFTYNENENFAFTALVRVGYTFTGWKITGLTTGHEKFVGQSTSSYTTIPAGSTEFTLSLGAPTTRVYFKNLRSTSGDVTFTAQWKLNNYNVSVSNGGGTGSGLATTSPVNYGDEGSFGFTALSRVGYTFIGWKFDGLTTGHEKLVGTASGDYTSIAASLTSYTFDITNSTAKIFFKNLRATNGQVTVTALWKINNYNVTVSPGIATGTGLSVTSPVNFGTEGNFGFTSLSKVGYTFTGWLISGLTTGHEKLVGTTSGSYTKIGATLTEYLFETSSPTAKVYFKDLRSSGGDVTITAQFTPNTYNVIINTGGGTGSPSTSSPFTYDADEHFAFASLTKLGYTLTGWKFTGLTTGHTKFVGTATNAYTQIESSRSDYTFSISNASATIYFKNLRSTSGDVNVTALWTANTYSVTIEKDGGVGNYTSTTPFTFDSDESFTFASLVKVGYTFTGWKFTGFTTGHTKSVGAATNNYTNIASDAAEFVMNTANPTATVYFKNLRSISGSVTVTALWTANTYSVVFATAGGVGTGPTNSAPYTFDSNEHFVYSALSKVGYTFKGWKITGLTEGHTKYVGLSASSYQSIPATTTEFTFETAGATSTIYFKNLRKESGNVTFTALWTANTYSVKIDTAGGVGDFTSTSPYTYDADENFKFSSLSKVGYTFAGWKFTGLDTGHEKLIGTSAATYVSVQANATEYTLSATDTTASVCFKNLRSVSDGQATITALWTPNTYSIEIDTAGGTGTGEATTSPFTFDVDESFVFAGLSRLGYTFTGWHITGLTTGHEKFVGTSTDNYSTISSALSEYTLTMSSPTAKIFFKNLRSGTGTAKFTAQWTANKYTITIMNNGAKLTTLVETYNTSWAPALISVPTNAGFKFNGVFTGENGGGTMIVDATGKVIAPTTQFTDNATIYVWWTDDEKPVIERCIYVQDSNLGYYVYCYATDNVGITKVAFPTWTSASGQDDLDKKWSTTQLGTFGNFNIDGQTYNYMFYVAVSAHNGEFGPYLTHIYAYDAQGNSGFKNADAFYFKFTVSLDPQGGSGGTSSIILTYNLKFMTSTITIPVLQGYVFGGYYTKTNGGGSQIIDKNGNVVGSKTFTTKDTTIYARWTPKYYNLSFVLEADNSSTKGAFLSGSAPTMAYFNTNFFVPQPTKAGYTFLGWNITGMSDSVQHLYFVGGAENKFNSINGRCPDPNNANDDFLFTADTYKNLHEGTDSGEGPTVIFTAIWQKKEFDFVYHYLPKDFNALENYDTVNLVSNMTVTQTLHVTYDTRFFALGATYSDLSSAGAFVPSELMLSKWYFFDHVLTEGEINDALDNPSTGEGAETMFDLFARGLNEGTVHAYAFYKSVEITLIYRVVKVGGTKNNLNDYVDYTTQTTSFGEALTLLNIEGVAGFMISYNNYSGGDVAWVEGSKTSITYYEYGGKTYTANSGAEIVWGLPARDTKTPRKPIYYMYAVYN